MMILVDDDTARVGRLAAVGSSPFEHWPAASFEPGSFLARRDPAVLVLGRSKHRPIGDKAVAELRRRGYSGPLIVLSDETPSSSLLDAGADAVLSSGVSLDELTSQIRAVSRRLSGGIGGRVEVGALAYDPLQDAFAVGDVRLALPPTGHRILATLIERPGRPVSREDLARRVFGSMSAHGLIPFHICRIRSKLDKAGLDGKAYLGHQLGRGYLVQAPA